MLVMLAYIIEYMYVIANMKHSLMGNKIQLCKNSSYSDVFAYI